MPRIVVIPAPIFDSDDVRIVGEALEKHIDTIVAIDDEWSQLISAHDNLDLALKLKMTVLDGISGCISGVGNVCHAVVLHRSDIELAWLDEDGVAKLLSVKEMLRRREILYAVTAELPKGVKLFRLQTYKPLEQKHARFFEEQFENLELEIYELLYGSADAERWRRITGAATLPRITETVARATRRFVMEFCIFDEYNICPGILLLGRDDRVDVKILRITSKPENNYVAQIDLAGLLANR